MAELTHSALLAGAMGFSTSRTPNHKTSDGHHLGTLRAGRAELTAIAGALARAGRGVLQIVSEATGSADAALVGSELELFRHLVETAQRPLSMSIAQSSEAPEQWRTLLDFAQQMSAAGHVVKGQVAPRPVGVIMSFATTMNPFMYTPIWQRRLAPLAAAARYALLCQPEVKQAILDEHRDTPLSDPMQRSVAGTFAGIYRFQDAVDYEPRATDSLAAEAAANGRAVADYAYEALLEDQGRRMFYLPFLNYVQGNLDAVHAMLEHPHSVYGLSDGGAHCGTICDASFPTTLLGLWPRGNRSGKQIALETVVRNLSARQAEFIGWHDRGYIKPGYLADLNLIDLARTALPPPRIVHDLPAGGMRLLQGAEVYRYTIKRGRVSFENGIATGALPGRLLRGAQPRPA